VAEIIIRGSSSSIFRNGEFQSDSDTGCPRRSYLRHLNIQEVPNAFTLQIFEIGFAFERYYSQFIPDAKFDVEVKVGNFTGHADAVDDNFVYETKSCTSKNTYSQIYKKGTPKPTHVIQLAGYMLALEYQAGKLVYGSYVTKQVDYAKLKKMPPSMIPALIAGIVPEIKEFIVTISDDGFIHVDGQPYEGLHVREFLDYQEELTALIAEDVLPPRVEALKPDAWSDPCKFCKLAMLCDSSPVSLEDFAADAADVFAGLAEEI